MSLILKSLKSFVPKFPRRFFFPFPSEPQPFEGANPRRHDRWEAAGGR